MMPFIQVMLTDDEAVIVRKALRRYADDTSLRRDLDMQEKEKCRIVRDMISEAIRTRKQA